MIDQPFLNSDADVIVSLMDVKNKGKLTHIRLCDGADSFFEKKEGHVTDE